VVKKYLHRWAHIAPHHEEENEKNEGLWDRRRVNFVKDNKADKKHQLLDQTTTITQLFTSSIQVDDS